MTLDIPKIGIDARKINDFGIGTYISNILYGISDLDGLNSYVLLVQPDVNFRQFGFGDNFKSILCRAKNYGVAEHFSLPYHMKSERIDLFHSPHYVVPRFLGKKTIVTIHDVIHLLFPEYLPNCFALTYAKYMLNYAARVAERIITVSENSKNDIIEHLGTPPDKIHVIYNGVNPSFHPRDQAMARDFVLKNYRIDRPFIFYNGSLSPRKNIPRLIQAFARVQKVFPEIILVIAGEIPDELHPVSIEIERTGMSSFVQFVGLLDLWNMPVMYSAAEVFVFPSLYEGFGLPPLEAAACGTPVVVSNAPPFPEILGDAVEFADPKNVDSIAQAIIRVLENSALYEALTMKGPRLAQKYPWMTAAEKTLDLYRELLI